MRKVLYIRFIIILYIFAGMFIFCAPVLSDTFDDEFIKNKKLETSIDLKNGTESNIMPPESQEKDNNDVTTNDAASVENNPTSLPPVVGDEKTAQANTGSEQEDSLSGDDGVPKPLYNDKKQALKPDNFYDNFVLGTTSTKLPKGNQNNIFLLGLVSIVVVITSIFLLVNFIRAQKDLNKQRELFHKNFDPLNIRQGFFSADYDIRNAKTDGIEIVKSTQAPSDNENNLSEDMVEPAEELMPVTASAEVVPSSQEVSVKEEFVGQPAHDELSYQLKEANKVFEENLEGELPEAVSQQNENKEDVLSDDELDFIDAINNSDSEDSLQTKEELSFEEEDEKQEGFNQDITSDVVEDSHPVQSAVEEDALYVEEKDILVEPAVSSMQVEQPEDSIPQSDEEEPLPSDIFVEDIPSVVVENPQEEIITEDEVVEEVPEVLPDEEVVFIQEEVEPPVEEAVSLETQQDEEDIIPVQNVVFEQEVSQPSIEDIKQAAVEDKSPEKVIEQSEVQEHEPSTTVDIPVSAKEAEEEKPSEPEKTEEEKALEKFDIVDVCKIDDNKEILLIKEGFRYSFMARVYTEVFKLFDMNQPDKINRIKEIDEKQGDKQVYMIKGEQHRILFAMNDKEASFIMEL